MKSPALLRGFLSVIVFSPADPGDSVMGLLGIPSKTSVQVSKSDKSPQLAQVAVVPDLLT